LYPKTIKRFDKNTDSIIPKTSQFVLSVKPRYKIKAVYVETALV